MNNISKSIAKQHKSWSIRYGAPRYSVVIVNDDFTPMEFVVDVLQRFFGFDEARAVKTMLQVHCQGQASCGEFTKEIAEMKVNQVLVYAGINQHPLSCRMEKLD